MMMTRRILLAALAVLLLAAVATVVIAAPAARKPAAPPTPEPARPRDAAPKPKTPEAPAPTARPTAPLAANADANKQQQQQREQPPVAPAPTPAAAPTAAPTATPPAAPAPAAAAPIALDPELRKYDLTQGGAQHELLAGAHALHQEALRIRGLFLAAHESLSTPQIAEVADKLVPHLAERLLVQCDKVNVEVDRWDVQSAAFRTRLEELNSMAEASALPERDEALQASIAETATSLTQSEERFSQARTVQHICHTTSGYLEQLAVESEFARADVTRKLSAQDL